MSELVDLFGSPQTPTRAYGSHESASGGSDEWLTPPHIIEALGPFDLDPCSPRVRPWPTAREHLTIEDDGLRRQWSGRVWCNPPYAHLAKWVARLAEHGTGTALLFARTETVAWHEHVWPHATAALFLRGRLRFCYVNGKPADAAGAPSALIAYGAEDAERLATSGLRGALVQLRQAAA